MFRLKKQSGKGKTGFTAASDRLSRDVGKERYSECGEPHKVQPGCQVQVLPQQQARHIRSRLRPLPEADVPRPIRPLLDDTHRQVRAQAYYERR